MAIAGGTPTPGVGVDPSPTFRGGTGQGLATDTGSLLLPSASATGLKSGGPFSGGDSSSDDTVKHIGKTIGIAVVSYAFTCFRFQWHLYYFARASS